VHPPIIKKKGVPMAPSQKALQPFAIWESDDPANDFRRFEMGNVTQNAYLEVAALEQRVEQTTGISDIGVQGIARSGNSANRTATGISAQTTAAGRRVNYQVENIEDQFIVPLLNNLHYLNQKFLDPQQKQLLLGPDAQNDVIDPLDVLNA